MYTMTITKSGQVTLPKELRDFLGVKIGSKITFRKTQNEVYITKRLSDDEFLERLSSIRKKHGSSTKNTTDAVDAVRAYRDGKIKSVNSGYKEKYV